ncbi:Aspartate aminotransferase [Aquimixticola soesokkakensis]|uniref:Aminotransferase n=1 Tax=Aquimixticola soesokkakensis TaxID=1519096 RepID=A0A1Y5RWS3_9RHOB|nr:pyridoxal phosphate-dependent aminotransferase [Aquimixticola soesokkakensis]SLN27075.1 Aspartate aminotransferase [Aquimixticola soesokkakensis]
MTHLSSRMSRVGASPTAAISDTLRRLSAQGHDVINLGEGELDFATPPHVCEAGIAAIRAGATKYTAVSGTAALKAAIARKFLRDNDLTYPPEQIIAGAGAKQLIFNALLATIDAGDEVLVPAPYWVSYPDMVRLAGGEPVIVATSPRTGWKLTPQDLAAHLTPRTKWVILNSPNNPTGAVYTRAELAALAGVLVGHDALIMADDIYEHMIHEGTFIAPASAMPDLFERILTINGVSKGYSMTGWRLGFAAGPLWLIRAMDTLQSQSTSNASTISQAAAIAALDGDMAFVAGWRARLRARRDLLIGAIDDIAGLSCDVPPGSFYVFADCRGLFGTVAPDGARLETDGDVAAFLVRDAHIGVVPGSAFGTAGYLRLAYAIDDQLLGQAIARLKTSLGKLTPALAAG